MAEQHMDEEQMKALQEKIKNMSPEELKEFQKKQCIFCQIVSGRVPSKKIYEDNEVLAVLDINPASLGHILLLPKEHYSILPQMPDELIRHIFIVAKTLSNAALRGLEVAGANIFVANGVAAGQKAQHFMVHLIPRKDDDGLIFDIPQAGHSEKELLEIAQKIASGMGMQFKEPNLGGQTIEKPKAPIEQTRPVEIIAPRRQQPRNAETIAPKAQPIKTPPKKEIAAKKEVQKPRKKDTIDEDTDGENDKGDRGDQDEKDESSGDKSKLDLDDIARMLGVK